MAKLGKTLFPLSGTLAGFTFVDSRTYQRHIRRPRGTVKQATVNQVLQKNANNAKKITALGRMLLQCFKEMGKSFAQRGLWQVMMNRMFKAKSVSVYDLLLSIDGMELNMEYPIDHILGPLPPIKTSVKNNKLNVQVTPLPVPHFSDKVKADAYRYELFVTWIDAKGSRFEGDVASTKWISLEEEAGKLSFNFTKPKWVKYGLLVLKVVGAMRENEAGFAGTGMRVVGVI